MADGIGGLFGTGIGGNRESILQQILKDRQTRNVAATQNLGKYAGLAQAGMESAQRTQDQTAKLFGIEDPKLQKDTKINDAAEAVRQRGINTKDPVATYEAFYDELAKRGLYGEATALIPKIQEAQAKAKKEKREETRATQEEIKFITDNPQQAEVELARLAKIIEADPTNQEALDRYQRIAQAGTQGAIEQTMKQEKQQLEIDKARQDMTAEGKLSSVDKYNSEIQSARDLLNVYGIDPTKPIKDQVPSNILYGPGGASLLNAQQKALLKKTTEGGTPLSAPSPAAAPAAASNIEAAVKASGVPYEPNKYDYRIVNGQVQRKPKGN